MLDTGGRKIERILVRVTNWIGDALLNTPAISVLRDNFPGARISVLAKPWVAPVFAGHPAVDGIILFDRAGRHKGPAGLWLLASELRRERFDLAVLFQNAFEAALLARLAGIPLRLGYNTDGRGLLLNRAVRLTCGDKQVHETEYYLRMLKRAGLTASKTRPVFYLSREAEEQAAARLRELGLEGAFLVGLAPGAAYGTAKRWPAERFAAAADMILAGRPGAALLFGSKGEAAVTAEVAGNMKSPVFDLAGRTDLAEAAALIKLCRVFLSNDSGLMHTAAAVGTPLAAIFGPTNPVTTSPVAERFRLIRHPVGCSPCLKQECPLPERICMETVTAGEVAAEAMELLKESEHGR